MGWLNKLRADLERENLHSLKNGEDQKNGTNGEKHKDNGDEDTAEGYIGNARYYLNKSMSVHQKNPTDDDDLVSSVQI